MGMYLERLSDGSSLYGDKGTALVKDGATVVAGNEWEPTLVCVVRNPGFEAAGWVYNREEHQYWIQSFLNGDSRPHIWLRATPEQMRANFLKSTLEEYAPNTLIHG